MELNDLRIVDSPVLVRDHTLEKLRDAISSGLYPPGTRLIERELCDALGVSRTSVREALRQLQSENLVEVGKRRNISVAVVTPDVAEDIYMVRELLESVAIRRFVDRADPDAIRRLQSINREMRKLAKKGGVRQMALLAADFYETILLGSGSKVLYDQTRHLVTRVSYLRHRAMSSPGRLAAGLEEWDRIVDAVVAGDAAAAAKAMVDHLRNARRSVVASLRDEQVAAAS